MTEHEAIILFDSKFWEDMEPLEIAKFQLQHDRLCMPFHVLRMSVTAALDRPVAMWEFARNWDGLRQELLFSKSNAKKGE